MGRPPQRRNESGRAIRLVVFVAVTLLVIAGRRVSAAEMMISSPAFANNGSISAANTCDGSAGNPALAFTAVPRSARSLAVMVVDPDVPWLLQSDHKYVHWLRWNLPPAATGIGEGQASGGVSEGGESGYVAPCPPIGGHRYVFKLFALDAMLAPDLHVSSDDDLNRAMEGHILASAETTGRYARPLSTLAVPLAILALLFLCVLGVLYVVYRGVRYLSRRAV